MRRVIFTVFCLTTIFASYSAIAHHSFSAEFDVSRPVNLTGTVTKIEWTNPHAWVFMAVKGESGTVENWAIEMLGINALIRSGMSPQNVKPGVVLTVKGFGSRDGRNAANASLVIMTETGQRLWASAREDAEEDSE
jgi:hypothetical protein